MGMTRKQLDGNYGTREILRWADFYTQNIQYVLYDGPIKSY